MYIIQLTSLDAGLDAGHNSSQVTGRRGQSTSKNRGTLLEKYWKSTARHKEPMGTAGGGAAMSCDVTYAPRIMIRSIMIEHNVA